METVKSIQQIRDGYVDGIAPVSIEITEEEYIEECLSASADFNEVLSEVFRMAYKLGANDGLKDKVMDDPIIPSKLREVPSWLKR